jgi:hypothetical protein
MALRLTTATAGVFAVAYGGGQRAPRNRENAAAAWRGFARQDE